MFLSVLNKKKRLLLCSILLLAALLRIYGIDWGIPGAGSNRAYHPDERMAPLTLSRMDPSQGRFNPYYFINPTLFYYQYGLFLLPVSRITGITPPWQIDSYPAFVDHNMEEQRVWYLTGRMLTVVMGLVTVWGVFWLGSLLAGVPVGVLGAAIFACLPAHVIQSHYMVVDAPAVMWMVLSLAFFAMALERKKAWVFAASGLFLGLGLATKYTVALIALPQLVLVIQEAWINRASGGVKKKNQAPGAKRSGKSRKTPPRGKAPRAGIAAGWLMGCWHWFLAWAGFSGLGFIIGCPYALLDRVGFLGKTGIGGLVGYNVFGFSLTRVFTLDFFYGLGLPLALAAIAGTVFLLSRPRKKVFCLGVILLVSILMLILNASPYMRHFVPLTPFLAVAAAYLLVELYQGRIPLLGGFPPKLALTLAAVVFLYTAGYSAALVSQMGREDNRTACAAWIGENASQYEVIAVAKPEWGSDFYSVDFDDGYYSRVVTGYNYQLLKDYKPDYLILSEYERIDCLMNDEGRGECLVEKLDGSTDFEPVIAFKRDLSILGLPFPYSSPGYDWLYFCPNITLYAPRAGEDSSRTFYLRGRETLDRNDLPGAVGLLRESVELESTNPLYRLWLGRVEMVAAAPSLNAGKTAKAIDYLNRAQQNTQMGLRVAPKTWMRIELLGLQAESRVRLGTLLSENGRMKDAEITLLASLEDMKSQKTAIDSLDNVTLREWDNNYRQVLTTLSYFYIRTKELGKADKWVGEMLQRNENDVQALLLKADLFLRRGGHEREALATIEYVLKLDPSMLDDDKTNLAELVKRLREMVDKLPESQTP